MRIQKTNPAFNLDKSTAWHVVDEYGIVVHFAFTKREARQWIIDREAAAFDEEFSNEPPYSYAADLADSRRAMGWI